MIFVLEQNQLQIGKKHCKINHKKNPCHSGGHITRNQLIEAFYKENFPEFCRKWGRDFPKKIPANDRTVNTWKKNLEKFGSVMAPRIGSKVACKPFREEIFVYKLQFSSTFK